MKQKIYNNITKYTICIFYLFIFVYIASEMDNNIFFHKWNYVSYILFHIIIDIIYKKLYPICSNYHYHSLKMFLYIKIK